MRPSSRTNQTRPFGTSKRGSSASDQCDGTFAEDPADCQLYLFDDGSPSVPACLIDPRTHRKWSKWDPLKQCWAPLPGLPPAPTGNGATSPRSSSANARVSSPRAAYGAGAQPRGASPFVRPRSGNRPPINPSSVTSGGRRLGGQAQAQPCYVMLCYVIK